MDARSAEKKAIEDARFVLPNACVTKMICTMNTRSLMNFFRHRCCNRAQWEIRELAEQMLREVVKVAPHLFAKAGPACYKGACPEGKMTCGKCMEMREHYRRIHQIHALRLHRWRGSGAWREKEENQLEDRQSRGLYVRQSGRQEIRHQPLYHSC